MIIKKQKDMVFYINEFKSALGSGLNQELKLKSSVFPNEIAKQGSKPIYNPKWFTNWNQELLDKVRMHKKLND